MSQSAVRPPGRRWMLAAGLLTILATAALPSGALAKTCALCVLSPSANHALEVNGGSKVTVEDGNVAVNSTARAAADLSGGSQVIAGTAGSPRHIYVVGGWMTSGGAFFSPAPESIAGAPLDDPFASVPVPAATGPDRGSLTPGGSQQVTAQPGTYSTLGASGGADLKLNPGVYHVTRSFFNSGTDHIHGTGVEIVLERGVGVNLSGNTTTELVAPDRGNGSFNEIVFFFDRASTATFKIDNVKSALFTGGLYGKSANLSVQRLRVVGPTVAFATVDVHSGGRFLLD